MKRAKILILCGGRSAEHEVSIRSARNVTQGLDSKRYQVQVAGISRAGMWYRISLNDFKRGPFKKVDRRVGSEIRNILSFLGGFDVVFPVLHGPFGEDGVVQGLLKVADVPFVGAGVLGSAVGMDKDVMKRLLRDAGVPVAKWVVAHTHEKPRFADVKKRLGLPMFIKPANLGSSVGVSKVRNEKEFKQALKEALRFDTKVLIEEYINGREIECAVLGNVKPTTSVPGELVVKSDFYSYEAKYFDEGAMVPRIPAKLSKTLTKKVQVTAVATYKALCGEGMGRVDSFVTKNEKVIVNEINTIPGFTNISMYPKLWEASGLPYSKLIDRLIQLAIERHKREKKLKTSV